MGRKRKADATDPFSLEVLIVDHLEHLAASNYSPSTIRNRRSNLRRFRVWCAERNVTRPLEITQAVLEQYRQWLFRYRKESGEPLSWSSQSQSLIAVKVFLRHLVRRSYLLYNPAAEMELPRKAKYLPTAVFTVSEVEQVIAQPDVYDLVGLRDRAILETFYSTGMRRMEVVYLRVNDVDFQRGIVVVHQGKGKKDRVVPIGERALAWIRRYLEEARPQLSTGDDDGQLFLNTRGRPFQLKRMTELCRKYVLASGVEKKGSCHIFRHTAATLMLENGADIRFIQQQLGHEHLSSTDVYTRVTITKLKEVHAATHPAKLERTSTVAAELLEAATSPQDRLLAALRADGDEEDAEN